MKKIKLKTLYICDRCGKKSYSPELTCNCKNEWKLEHSIIWLLVGIIILILLWAICNV